MLVDKALHRAPILAADRWGRMIVVITLPLSQDGGTARTAIKVHAVNLIEIRLGERWQPISNQS